MASADNARTGFLAKQKLAVEQQPLRSIMELKHILVACVGLNVVLFGMVSAPPRREVQGRDGVRNEYARRNAFTERESGRTNVFASAEVSQNATHVDRRSASAAHVLPFRAIASMLSVNANSIAPAESRSTSTARNHERQIFNDASGVATVNTTDTDDIGSARRSRENYRSQEFATVSVSRAQLPAASGAELASVPATNQPVSPMAELAAKDGFEPVTSDPRAAGAVFTNSADDTEIGMPDSDRQAGIVTIEDQQIRALHGWSAFQRYQKEKVVQEIQEKGG